jgi:hypothetical protein
VAGALESEIKRLWDADAWRREETERNTRRFGVWMSGLFPDGSVSPRARQREDLRINIVKSAVETIAARVGSNRPRPRVLTTDGDHSLKVQAKKLQRFLDGVYTASDVYEISPDVFRDGMLSGTGVFGFDVDVARKCVKARRVYPLELLVDPVDAVDGDPSMLTRIRFLDRDDLIEAWPDHEEAIVAARVFGPDESSTTRFAHLAAANPRVVRVGYGWRRASYTADGEQIAGRFVMAVGSAVLIDRPWPHDYFPFSRFHFTKPLRGWWGAPAATEIRPLEQEFNRLLQQAQAAMRVAGGPIVLTPKSAKVKTAKLTDQPGAVVEYEGNIPPSVVTVSNPVSPQILSQAWQLYAKAFEIVGTNQLNAAAVKPAGIESGRALEQLGEETSARFKQVSQHFEHVVAVDCSRQFIRAAAELDAALKERGEAEGYVLRSRQGKQMLKLKWADAALSPDDFFVDTFPVGLLPALPAGRIQAVEEYMRLGLIDSTIAAELLEFPDLDSVSNPVRADFHLLEKQIEQMLEDGEDVLPDPRQNLKRALTYGTFCLLKGLHDKVPEERLDLLRAFLAECEQLLAPPPPEPALDAGGAPPVAGPEGLPPDAGPMAGGGAPPSAPGGPPPPPGLPPDAGGLPPAPMN